MLKKLFFVFIIFFSSSSFSEENLLTLKQQMDRLQRELNDLSKIVYNNNFTSSEENSNQIDPNNLSAFDMRIYDIEKDIKNINNSIENIVFEIDEIKVHIEEFNLKLNDFFISNKENTNAKEQNANNEKNDEEQNENKENSLGTLKITSEDLSNNQENNEINQENNLVDEKIDLSPDEQFQKAFDLLRSQNFDKAKDALEKFITTNPENDLAGSAHYWLGEIYLLKKDYREAALTFAEGFQKYPNSFKAPDILYKLSGALIQIDKKNEACNTLAKFKKDFGTHKLIENINSRYLELKCEQ
tara:strand:- start:191 stop:1090 length:900 start_codon:yes stop_codon:yes gene_type:complete